MNALLRVGPYVYGALHSYNSVWELLLSASEGRIADDDATRLRASYPFFAAFPRLAEAHRQRLLPIYRQYTATVSPDPIAISLELAVFLAVLCEARRPKTILDLGSGFSSYVFGAHAKQHGDGDVIVHSIDQSTEWLDKTRAFLEGQDLHAEHLGSWEELVLSKTRPRAFDLVLQDIATLGTRLEMLDVVLGMCRPGGLIVIDDMHVPGYRFSVLKELRQRKLTHFSLRSYTKKRLRYSYLVAP
jgi:predicted O-methyltransferase YrrM